jgi:cell division protein FtsI (penicillin-binding protein 3)
MMEWKSRAPNLQLRLDGRRATFVLVLLCSLCLVLVGRAIYLQMVNTDFLQAKGNARYNRTVITQAARGNITDREGKALATSVEALSIWADPSEVPDDKPTRAKLAKALNMPVSELNNRLKNQKRDFVYLRRQMEKDAAQKVLALEIDGVDAQREFRRDYPLAEITAHVVGFTNIEDRGQEGVELAYDKQLTGRSGERRVVKDRKGRVVEERLSLREAKAGNHVALSIDQRLQAVTYDALKAAVSEHRAEGASAVVLDAKSGEVLALVNLPDFNPNQRNKVMGANTRNRSVTDLFEPGSTMKPFTIALGLEAGVVTPTTVINTQGGTITIGGRTIHDVTGHAQLTTAEIVQKSSNVGTIKISQKLERQQQWGLYRDLGFGQVPGTGFPGEAAGRLRPFKDWSEVDKASMSYGYGINMSLIQLARSYTVWVNDGRILPVTFVKRDASNASNVSTQIIGKQVMSPGTAREVAKMLEGAAANYKNATVAGYRIAGKTGTAKRAANGGYEQKYIASFVGFAPASEPRYIVAVRVDDPSAGRYYGGDVAAPIFSTIMTRVLSLNSVSPDQPDAKIIEAGRDPAQRNRAEVLPNSAAQLPVGLSIERLPDYDTHALLESRG